MFLCFMKGEKFEKRKDDIDKMNMATHNPNLYIMCLVQDLEYFIEQF